MTTSSDPGQWPPAAGPARADEGALWDDFAGSPPRSDRSVAIGDGRRGRPLSRPGSRRAARHRARRTLTVLIVVLCVAAPIGGFLAANAFSHHRWAAVLESGDCLAGPAPGPEGGPAKGCVGVLSIPRLGDDWAVPIWAGTGVLSLAQGVGWVSDTTAPGQVGNFVIVGQRLGAGQPFIDLLDLDAGDQVVVETADHVYTYTLDVAPRDLTVNHTAAWVLDPVPGGEKLVPQRPLITLITAQDLLRTSDRSVGIGLLSDVRDR